MRIGMNHTVMIDHEYEVNKLPIFWDQLTSTSKHAWLRSHGLCVSTNMKELRSVINESEVFPEIVDAYVLN